MGDENPQQGPDNEEADKEGEELEEAGEMPESAAGEGLEGEAGEFQVPLEPRASLLSDFCEEELSDEEEGGEWICREMEEGGEYYEEGFFTPGEFEGEKEPEMEIEEKRSLDSQYLKAVLGTPLTYALLDIATRRPTDPIQYLGHFLLRWRWCGENKEKYEENMKELTDERTAYIEKMKEKQRQEMLVKEEQLESERRAEKVESSLEDDDDDDDDGIFGESQQTIDK